MKTEIMQLKEVNQMRKNQKPIGLTIYLLPKQGANIQN